MINKTLRYFEGKIVTAPVENAIIITNKGEVYHCSGGLNSLDSIVELGDKLNGSSVTHNHPLGSDNEYTFSELDFALFADYNLARLRGIDEKFIYELNRNSADLDSDNALLDEYNYKHWDNVRKAKAYGCGYRRWAR